MVKPVEEILSYTPERFYALDEATRWEYLLIADEFLRNKYKEELAESGGWMLYVDGLGVVFKHGDNRDVSTPDLMDELENKYGKIVFLIHHESLTDEFSSEISRSKEPTLNERLELRLTGL